MPKDDPQLMETTRPVLKSRPRPQAMPAVGWTESAAAWLLGAPLSLALLGLCAAQLASWVPHYLTWPWFADHEVFATLALGWEHGQLPYRDLAGNNFPGTVYLFWLLGKLYGWGRTEVLYAVDAGFVLILGAALLAWSRRRFGRFLPGLGGFAVFLSYYLNLDFSRTAQRDWHGPFFFVVGLLFVDAYPGRWSRRLSALTTALALVFRPQVVVLVPALLLAILQGARAELEAEARAKAGPETRRLPAWTRLAGIVLGWATLAALLTVLAFAPLGFAGLLGDFFRSIGITYYGGGYNKATVASIANQMLLQVLHLEFDLVPIAILVLVSLADPATRRSAWVWLLAYLGVWFYKPLSPVPFPYLEHPLRLVWAINLAVLVQIVLTQSVARPAFRLAAVLLALGIGVQAKPLFCSVAYSRQAIEPLRAGTPPVRPPLGLHIGLPVKPKDLAYPWNDYREMLVYLRTRTSPEARVANLLHVAPAVNGAAARLTPLPAESLAWLAVKPDAEPAYAKALERAPADSLVVWTPAMGSFVDLYEHYQEVERLAPVVRRYYEPSARFGDIEVWKRKNDGRLSNYRR